MIPRAASVVTRRRALSSISGSASAVAAAAPRMVKQQRHGQQQQQRGLFFVQLTALAQPPAPMLHPSFDVPRPSFLRPRVQPPTPTPLPRSSTAAPTTPLAVPSPLSLPTGAHRGINTQARARTQQPTGPHGSSTAQSAVRLRGRLRRQQLQQRRGFWSPRFMKQIGVPWVVQVREQTSAKANSTVSLLTHICFAPTDFLRHASHDRNRCAGRIALRHLLRLWLPLPPRLCGLPPLLAAYVSIAFIQRLLQSTSQPSDPKQTCFHSKSQARNWRGRCYVGQPKVLRAPFSGP